MSSSLSSIEQQHQEFKRQISSHDTYPCFLLDQTFQQRVSSPTTNVLPSFLSAQAFSPLGKSPITPLPAGNNRLSTKQTNTYRYIPSSPSNNFNVTRTTPTQTAATTTAAAATRSTTQVVDVPIEKTIVPLRTMTDLFPAFSYSHMITPNKRSVSYSSHSNNPIAPTTNGVSIFGFREEDLERIVQQFEDIGQFESIERPLGCENGNFLNIIYKNHVSYQNALNRNGQIFNGYMIGVVPLLIK